MSKCNFVLPDELYRAVKIYCAKSGTNITKYLIALVVDDLRKRGEYIERENAKRLPDN